MATYSDDAGQKFETKDTVVAGRNWSGDWGPRPPSSKIGGGQITSGGYGAGSSYRPTTVQTKKAEPITFKPPKFESPKFQEPEMGEMPTFEAPEYDEGKVEKMSQRYAAPGIRKLRSAVQLAATRRYENPNLRRMTLRDALAGYGEGLENVMAGAHKQATSEYAQQYAYKYKEAGMNYQTAVQAVRDKYRGKMESRKMDFQAELAAVNATYRGELEAERFRVDEARRTSSFDYAFDEFKKTLL